MNPNKDHLPTPDVHPTPHHEKHTPTRELQRHTTHSHESKPNPKTAEHYKIETENAHNFAASEKEHRERTSQPPSTTEYHRGPIRVDEEFTHTIVSIQQEMTPSQRAFSRFIHTKPVENTSDFLAATIIRPNAMLAGSISAFILMLALYLFTKSIGYTLSGFELIGTFAIGWILGMFYDYIRTMLGNK